MLSSNHGDPYFAYSIKQEFRSSSVPCDAYKVPRKKNRACDACAIRKTKCDEKRPCRHCIDNNLECTEYRERKKSGPKNLRLKTVNSIHSFVSARSAAASPAPDSSIVADFFDAIPEISHLAASLVSFTAPSLTRCLPEVTAFLRELAPAGDLALASKAFALSSFALLLSEAVIRSKASAPLLAGVDMSKYSVLLHQKTASAFAAINSQIMMSPSKPGSSVHYYLSLAELHMFGYLFFSRKSHNDKLVHLRSAISHFQIISIPSDYEVSSLAELRRCLYCAERSAYLFSPDSVFRHSGLIIRPYPRYSPDQSTSDTVLDFMHSLFHVLDEYLFFQNQQIPEPMTWRHVQSGPDNGIYGSIKVKIHDALQKTKLVSSPSAAVLCEILSIIILMKVLQPYANQYNHQTVNLELLDMVLRINPHLQRLQSKGLDNYDRISFSSIPLVPQLLELLRSYLVVTDGKINPNNIPHIDSFCALVISLEDTVEDFSQIYGGDYMLNEYLTSYFGGHGEFHLH